MSGSYIMLSYVLQPTWAKSKKERRKIGRRIRRENRAMKKYFVERLFR